MKIYISHAREDTPAARQLARRLEEAGLKAWVSEDEILPGDNWAKKVGQALEESDLMVVLVSGHAPEWQKEEIQYALTAGQYRGRLIPVFLGAEGATARNFPWILGRLNPVSVGAGNEEDWQQVVSKVQTLAG